MKSFATFLIILMFSGEVYSFPETTLPNQVEGMSDTSRTLNQLTPEENERSFEGPQDQQERIYQEEQERQLKREREQGWQEQIEGSRFDEPDL